MEIIAVLMGISLVVASGFLGAFIWAKRKGQFDDDYTPGIRILFDDITTNNKSVKQPKIKGDQ